MTTATRIQERENVNALVGLIRVLALARAAELAAVEPFVTYDAAVAMREAIASRIDVELDAADDSTFAALEQLRADLASTLPGEASDLPRLARYTPPVTVPSLVLAHRLYGDLSREPDLVARNRIQNPCFIVGGTELEVLSDP
jgi:prophage DNA circulation protein